MVHHAGVCKLTRGTDLRKRPRCVAACRQCRNCRLGADGQASRRSGSASWQSAGPCLPLGQARVGLRAGRSPVLGALSAKAPAHRAARRKPRHARQTHHLATVWQFKFGNSGQRPLSPPSRSKSPVSKSRLRLCSKRLHRRRPPGGQRPLGSCRQRELIRCPGPRGATPSSSSSCRGAQPGCRTPVMQAHHQGRSSGLDSGKVCRNPAGLCCRSGTQAAPVRRPHPLRRHLRGRDDPQAVDRHEAPTWQSLPLFLAHWQAV